MKAPRQTLLTFRSLAAGLLLGAASLSPAQVTQMLHDSPTSPSLRTAYNGTVGCKFQVGPTNVVVSHVGVYDPSGGGGLNDSYPAGVMDTGYNLLGGVVVPAGASAYLTNSYWWMPLDPPLLLNSNTVYYLASVVGPNDQWPDVYTPASWNKWFVGNTATSTRAAQYGPGYAAGLTPAWPPPYMSPNGNNNTYGNVMLGYIEVGQARVGVAQTNVTIPEGQTLRAGGFASGQPSITYQWYKVGVGLLAGQTAATLVISNAPVSASGTYYLTATNSLGGEQSANVIVSVTSFPVGITQNPTNVTAFANYPVTFSCVATGTPSIYYQWLRNSTVIPGATSASYSLTAQTTDNTAVYSCVASNNLSSGPHTATTAGAALTVLANLALPQQVLHGYKTGIGPNTYGGQQGGQFVVGSNPVLVTHLGYYAWPANTTTNAGVITCNLVGDHHVGLYNANGTTLLGSVDVPAGSNPVINGYMWQPLDPPLVLSTNTQYLLVAETISGQGDWGDTYAISDLNPYFASSCDAIYGGAGWGNTPYLGGGYGGQMYSAPNMALLAPAVPIAWVYSTSVTQYVGLNVVLTAGVAGQAPVTLQWYKSPSTLLTGQTNLQLNLNSLALGDAGDYYAIVTNPGGNVQSGNATLTVLPDVGPSVDQDIADQNAFAHQTVQFVTAISGTPPFTYQWTFNGSPIPGATGNVLTLNDVSAASVGNYQLRVTNNFGYSNSVVAALTVTIPAWGSYAAGVMGPNLLAYYRFSDVNNGSGVATNQGSLGFACNGTYEGGYASIAGPTGMSNFEGDNLAVSLDGFTADVLVPALNNVVVSNATIAAWVYDASGQPANTAIFFHRQTDVFGLTISPNPTTSADELRYTWNNTYYTFSSGLALPTNQWAFVAVVVSPTNATLYLQDGTGLKSTNNAAAHTASAFTGVSYIGYDTAGGSTGRRWTGPIDEVMIFDQALSHTAINSLYLGVPASATLTLAPAAGHNLVLTWPGGTLLEATNITGPWAPTAGSPASPYTLAPAGTAKFYRVRLQ